MTLSIGLVGCGHWGGYILRDLLSLDCSVRAMVRSPENTKRAQDGGVTAIVRSIDALGGVDGIVVATPTTTHAAVLEDVLKLRVPIFVEKPLCTDGGSAQHLVEVGNGRLFVMDKWRYHPGVEALRDVLRSGEIGDFKGLRTWRMGKGDRKSDTDVIWHLLPHDLSIVFEILGRYPVPASAEARVTDEPIEILVRSEDGIQIRVSDDHPKRKRSVRLVGSQGWAALQNPYHGFIQVKRNRFVENRSISTDMPLKKELAVFIDHLRGGPPPKSSVSDAAESVFLMEKIRRLAGLSA